MPPKSIAYVFVIDDHELIRRGFRDLINDTDDMQVCCEAGSITEAMQKLATTRKPDAVVIDLSLPDGSGLELIKRLHTRFPEIDILVSSMYEEDLFAERVLRAGARGYINKQDTCVNLLTALRTVMKGDIYLNTDRVSRHLLNGDRRTALTDESPHSLLSDREMEVYELIGQGKKTTEIAELLHLSVKTIETYRAHIKHKLDLDSSTALTQHAILWRLEQG